MKAIVNTGAGILKWQECSSPTPGSGQVRVRTLAVGICATDLEMISGWERTGFPAIPGHEWAGVVDAVGPGIEPALIGKRCVADNVWQDGGEVGFEHAGGYGEYLLTEANNIRVLPDDMDPVTAALIEPLAVRIAGIRGIIASLVCPMQAVMPWEDVWRALNSRFLVGQKAKRLRWIQALGFGPSPILCSRRLGRGATQAAASNSSWRSRWTGAMGGALDGRPTALRNA